MVVKRERRVRVRLCKGGDSLINALGSSRLTDGLDGYILVFQNSLLILANVQPFLLASQYVIKKCYLLASTKAL